MILLASVTLFAILPRFWTDYPWRDAFQLLLSIAFVGAVIGNLRCGYRSDIVPYFDRKIGDIDTFGRGHALARNCRLLDRLAMEAGLPTVSSFGFADDMASERPRWHSPLEGLRTFRHLRDHLVGPVRGDPSCLALDIAKVIDALEKAAAIAASFCLLLRPTAGGMSGREMDQRLGTFF